MPIVEFLGPATGQLCAQVRIGWFGGGIYVFNFPNSICGAPLLTMYGSTANLLGWTQFAMTYDINTSTAITYINGTLANFFTSVFPGCQNV